MPNLARMLPFFSTLCLLALAIALSAFEGWRPSKGALRPNIIYVLADDLGYGELGSYGQKIIETPHLDALAAQGIRFTQHYAGAPVCAPSRCVLMTGRHLGHAEIRGNDEWGSRGDVWSLKAMLDNPRLEGQRPLSDSAVLFPQLLQAAGYATALVGKWGLGAPETNSVPTRKGFDYFFGYNCQRQAHTLYPTHLWENTARVFLQNRFVDIHQNLLPQLDPTLPESYQDYQLTDYAPEVMHQKALDFIDRSASTPFFLYYASPLPHVPLQAPERWVRYYQEKVGPETPYTKGGYYPNRTPRATYAAMISYLDEQIGELVTKLKEKGIYENTLLIVTSDNGPSYAGGAQPEFFRSGGPFRAEYGRGKGFVYEAGIRVPMIAVWPGKIRPNRATAHISGFQDVFPTVCELVGIKPPKASDGISFLPTLLGRKQPQHPFLYWEFPETGGQQALRMGKWKAVRTELHKGQVKTQLYDLEKDLAETTDVAHLYPSVVVQIEEYLRASHRESPNPRFKIAALGDQ